MHGHRKKTLFFLERLRALATERHVAPGRIRVLELGCGNGLVVSLPLAEGGFDVTGVDVHGPSIEWARSHGRLPNARFVEADFADFAGEPPYDAVILSDILEHVEDARGLLAVARTNVDDGGILLVSVPNGRGPYEIEQWLIRAGVLRPVLALTRVAVEGAVRAKRRLQGEPWPPPEPHAPAYNAESGHVHFFTARRLERLLRDSGFAVAEWRNGALMGGDLTYFVFTFVPGLVPLGLRLADRLPRSLVSTWQIACRPL